MKIISTHFILLLAGLFLFSCQTAPTSEGDQEGMAAFADDSTFQEKHEIPEDISPSLSGYFVDFETSDEIGSQAYVNRSDEGSKNVLFVFHEWWGLNDHIKQEADRWFAHLDEQVAVVALDLYDGKVAESREDASKYMRSVSSERAEAIIQGAMEYFAPGDNKIGTVGWCFGGGWSLKASILAEDNGAGCVMYYGMPVQERSELDPLKVDVLGIFAKEDAYINTDVVSAFEGLAKQANKSVEVHTFDADHAFANPSSPRYNEEAAQKANALSQAFLRKRLL